MILWKRLTSEGAYFLGFHVRWDAPIFLGYKWQQMTINKYPVAEEVICFCCKVDTLVVFILGCQFEIGYGRPQAIEV